MLHLKFALNLENLADQMIDEISSVWKNPFEAPVVIFPDPKLEQWFRLRWMKKKGVLANLNKSTIDRFLFDILVGNDCSKKKLTAEMLRNVILAYLMKKDSDGKCNYELLDAEVTRYLNVEYKEKDGTVGYKLDENHLFDFASKMASLFLEYETSRPKGFADKSVGLLDKWAQETSDDSLFFAESIHDAGRKEAIGNREKWQRKLYSAIFHEPRKGEDSLLTKVFRAISAERNEKVELKYLTIPFLYKECLEVDVPNFKLEKLPKDKNDSLLPIFIFGLSGMGQFYRVILEKYAEKYPVFAYIQNPCMEFWEDVDASRKRTKWTSANKVWTVEADVREKMKVGYDGTEETDIDDIKENIAEDENDLLCNWGRSGRDNIKLWCQAANYDFDFSDKGSEKTGPKTLLKLVQESVSKRTNAKKIKNDELWKDFDVAKVGKEDLSLTLTGAPTKIREIENLHSQICKLLQGNARMNDILVVSPCLDDYRTAIQSVFDQTPKKKTGAGEETNGYLHIPYAIVDSPAKSSLTESTLECLFLIMSEGSISRPAFFSLVRNSVVQQARHISDDEIEAWQNWVVETNTYRTRGEDENAKNDWIYAVRRLLLAQMTKNVVQFEEVEDSFETTAGKIKPFSDMASGDKASLYRFVECIDALQDWISLGKKNLTKGDLVTLKNKLNEWLLLQNVPDGFKSESVVYSRINAAIDELDYQFKTGLDEISWNIVKQTLLTEARGTEYSCGNLFVNGITFMKYAPNRVIPVKHVFFIGADSASFPGSKQRNTLDLRKSCNPWPGDESPVARNRYGFLCQLMSSTESFRISYVNKDIKKDAELYPSTVVSEIRKFLSDGGFKWEEIQLTLDEKRSFDELFTPRSLRNKVAYVNMMNRAEYVNAEQVSEESLPKVTTKAPERVSISQLAKFLKDPFQFRIDRMLSEDDEEDVEKESFEPICLDSLDRHIILKRKLESDIFGQESEKSAFKDDFELKGNVPEGFYGEKAWKNIDEKSESFKKNLDSKVAELQQSWKSNVTALLQLKRSNGQNWSLAGTLDWCNSENVSEVSELLVFSSSEAAPKDLGIDKFGAPYIEALLIIAAGGGAECGEAKKKVIVSLYSCKSLKTKLVDPVQKEICVTQCEAIDMLNKIYDYTFGNEGNGVSPFSKAVPIDLLNWPAKDEEGDIYAFRDKLLGSNGPWSHFKKKALFDVTKDVGFEPKDFQDLPEETKNRESWKSAVELMRGFFPKGFLPEQENTTDGDK